MKKAIVIFLGTVLFIPSVFSAPACAGAINPTCATATTLAAGAACTAGTTCSGGVQGASTCLFAGSQCSWYSFVATAASMVVSIDVGTTGGCHISSNVYSSTGACGGLTQLSCQAGAPLDDVYTFTTLVPGNTYYIQVCYSPGGPCGSAGSSGYADYCISVDEPDPLCNTCAVPCGTASGYAAPPTTATVVADCNTSPFVPELAASSNNTFCYSFQATATSVDFNVIITSNCGGGNVTGFSWSLYNASCGGAIQTGTLASLTFTGLTVGNDYVFCYTFTVPATCTHTQHCPYFVGATVLPVSLIDFAADFNGRTVDINWTTVSEMNNDYFTLERSVDGTNYEPVVIVDGAGNSNETIRYHAEDIRAANGLSYYRLKQTDFDGGFVFSDPVSVWVDELPDLLTIFPNPAEDWITVSFHAVLKEDFVLDLVDATGRIVDSYSIQAEEGINTFDLDLSLFNQGVYFITLTNKSEVLQTKFVKD